MRISDWSSDVCSSDLRDQRWAMARRLYPTVEQLRRETYARTSAQLRAEGLRPAPMAPYRPSALVAAIERATDAEPYVRPGRRDEDQLERVEPQTTHDADPDRKSVVWGKSVSVRVYLGGRRIIKKKKK